MLTGIELRWLVVRGSLDEYVKHRECVDKDVWAVNSLPGTRAVMFRDGIPCDVYIKNTQPFPVTIIHDISSYECDWGILAYGKLSAYPDHEPWRVTKFDVAGMRAKLKPPTSFYNKILVPAMLGPYCSIPARLIIA